MNVENALYPTPDRIADLMRDTSDKPIVMLNLLRFRAKAQYTDGRASDLRCGREFAMFMVSPCRNWLRAMADGSCSRAT